MKIIGTAIICGVNVDFELEDKTVCFFCDFADLETIATAKRDEKGKLYFDGSEHIKETIVKGLTSRNETIIFYISLSSVDFFRSVITCNLYSDYTANINQPFDAITIYGGDISIVVRNYDDHKIEPTADAIVIPFKSKKKYHSATFASGTKIKFACFDSYITKTRDKNPVEYVGAFQLIVSPTEAIKDIFEYVELVRRFISYLCFRNDITFDKVLLGTYDAASRKVTNHGEYVICNNPEIISLDSIKNKRFIPFCKIESKSSKIIRLIKENKLYLHHLRDGYKRIHNISGGDVVTLTAGFEYEFDASKIKIPPKKSEQEQKSYLLARYNAILKSKKLKSYGRSTIKTAKKHINDLMLETKLNVFFKDIPPSFLRSLERIYKYRDLVFKPTEVAKRIAKARNDFAHGLIKNDFTVEIIYDFLILEMVLYYVQLKRIGLADNDSFYCVCLLFGIRPD